MRGPIARGEDRAQALRARVGTVLFMAVFLFYWISLNPFVDLTGIAVLDPSAGNSNLVNQIVSLLLFFALLGFGLLHPMREVILQPRLLLAALFFRLSIEQRASQIGLLRAAGFAVAAVRRVFLLESAVIVILGAVAGAALTHHSSRLANDATTHFIADSSSAAIHGRVRPRRMRPSWRVSCQGGLDRSGAAALRP